MKNMVRAQCFQNMQQRKENERMKNMAGNENAVLIWKWSILEGKLAVTKL